MVDADTALEKFLLYRKEFDSFLEEDLTESDTRSKILDRILVDVLGWQERDIYREGYVKTVGYYDYLLTLPAFQFVVEAKRNFIELKLPFNTRNVRIKTLLKGNQEIIEQIRSYLIGKNLSIGVITNGHQFIISQFINVDGGDWTENYCTLYRSLQDIEDNFVDFFNDLSRDAIRNYGRIRLYKPEIEGKSLVDNIYDRNDKLIRNIFSAPLQPVIQMFFSDLVNSDGSESDLKFLKECYVKNEDIKKFTKELNILIEDDPPIYDERIIRVKNTDNTMQQIKTTINDGIKNLPDPILVIGGKGVGKTTFIQYFLNLVLDKERIKERLLIYLDFKDYSEQQINDTSGIYSQILTKLNDKYPELNLNKINILEKVYSKEISQFTDGIWSPIKSDTAEFNRRKSQFLEDQCKNFINHLSKISNYLIGTCRKRIIIIFDNVDQLTDTGQRSIYLLAQSIFRTIKAIIMLSLREGYFYKLKNSPPFDAFRSTIFHITAPPYSEVISRRLNYMLENYKFQEIKISGEMVKYKADTLKTLFENFKFTLFNDKNSDILKYLELSSFPNIRLGLDKLVEFLISANTPIIQYIYSTEYRIPIWEFIKSVALGSRKYYDHQDSKVYNLFYPSANNTNHFTKIRILLFIQNNIQNEKKYCEAKTIFKEFILAGYTKDIISFEIKDLFNYRLIEDNYSYVDTDQELEISDEMSFRITNAGYYYINDLIKRFHYLELVLQDTPIYDTDIFISILSNFPYVNGKGDRDLELRIKAVERFFVYLHRQEQKERANYSSTQLDKAFKIDITNEIVRPQLKGDMSRVLKARQNYKKK